MCRQSVDCLIVTDFSDLYPHRFGSEVTAGTSIVLLVVCTIRASAQVVGIAFAKIGRELSAKGGIAPGREY